MSDQADNRIKMAELLGTATRTLKIYAAQLKESGDTFTEKGLITIANDLQRLDDYLRSHTAPRELVAAAKLAMRALDDTLGDTDLDDDDSIQMRAHQALSAALSSHESKVCEWGFRKFNSTLDPNIYINCKNEPIVAMYYDLSAKPYCPYCGGVIKVKE